MKRQTVIVICLIMPVAFLSAQKYHFEYLEKEQTEIESNTYKEHFLGKDVAIKMQLMKEEYTYQEYNSYSRMETTAVEKSSIYNSVNKVNKYLKKGIKKGDISEPEAKEMLEKVLMVAINIRYQETSELEKELFSVKDPLAIATLYSEEIILN